VLFGKHTDKLEDDKAKRVFSMPVLLGEQLSRHTVIALLVSQYLLTAFLVVSGKFSWPLLLVFLNLSNLWQTGKEFLSAKPTERPAQYPTQIWPLWFSALAFRHTRRFTGLFLLGLAIDVLFF
jgi:1,4-dihydroxy-2-naphthoate octaprenyltransferase